MGSGIVTIFAFAMVAGFISNEFVCVRYIHRANVGTNIASFITVSGINMGNRICTQTAFRAHIPMAIGIVLVFGIKIMAIMLCVTASITGEETSAGEIVLSMCQSTAAIRTTRPMIQSVMIPISTGCMGKRFLFAAYRAYLLMNNFVDVGSITESMVISYRNAFFTLGTTDRTF